MQIWDKENILSLLVGNTEAYFFDCSGRPYATWDQGWFVSHGLSGRSIARRWSNNQRHARTLNADEQDRLEKKTQKILWIAADREMPLETKRTIRRCLAYDKDRDRAAFKSIYKPVGILPPDQYGACVVQVMEGCGWNRCHFCAFYHAQPYHLKNRAEIRKHIRNISTYFGEGLSLRRSIFLGEANALAAPLDVLLYSMEVSRAELIPKMPHFRGFYAFNETGSSSCAAEDDFRALGSAGLRRIYYGIETGNPELRSRLGKPGTLPAITESVHHAKAAGVRVALILLAGAGGKAWTREHVKDSIAFIRELPIDEGDIVYVSPLHGRDGTKELPLSNFELDIQMTELRQALTGKARVAPYDIREFVY